MKNCILNEIQKQSGGKSSRFQAVYSGSITNAVTDLDTLGSSSINAYEQFHADVLPASLVADANTVIARLADGMQQEHARLLTAPNAPETDAAKELYMSRLSEYTQKIPELQSVLADKTFEI